jgi:hypothetical protein
MAKIVNKYLDDIEITKLKVAQDADEILKNVDIDELLKDPEGYLLALSDAFMNEHKGEIEKGYKAGQKFADEVLKKI